MYEVCTKNGTDEGSKKSAAKIVFVLDKEVRTVVVNEEGGTSAKVAVKKLRLALQQESFATAVQYATDEIDDSTESTFTVVGNVEKSESACDALQAVKRRRHKYADFFGGREH